MSSRVAASTTSPLLLRLSRSFFSSLSLTCSVAARRVLACFLIELRWVCDFQSSLLFLNPNVPRRYSSCANWSALQGLRGRLYCFLGLLGSPNCYFSSFFSPASLAA